MRKQLTVFFILAVIFVSALCPISASAESIDKTAEASLSLSYEKEGQTFSELNISIYRVAEVYQYDMYKLTGAFESYPVNIYGIKSQEQWQNVADTLDSYIIRDKLSPDREGVTDEAGQILFEGLETGLYLVCEVTAENDSGRYVFNKFMVYLPTPAGNGSYNYNVTAKPKCINYVPKTEYRVTKLWQDAENRSERPENITVDIFRDGEIYETQTLSEANNWSYAWHVSEDDGGRWTVAERDVPDSYNVTVIENGASFSIINTHNSSTDTPDSPETGDTANPMLWILLMCLSGTAMIILSFSRGQREE